MDIHRPKAAHSIREFLIEIGTIICGILIALGLEQVVDLVHKRHLAEQARETIRKEAEANLGWMAFRLKSDDCVKSRINAVQDILLHWSPTRPLPTPLWIGRPITANLNSTAMDSAASTGRVALLSMEEQSTYATLRRFAQALEDNQTPERTVWSRLQVLENAPPYSQSLQSELLLALQDAKSYRSRAVAASRQALRDSRRLKVEPGPIGKYGALTPPACIPLNTPREKALELFYGASDRTSEP
jgi:hypothetical protein